MRTAQTWPQPATALSVLGHVLLLALVVSETPRRLTVTKQQPVAVDVMMVASATPQPAPIAAPPSTVAAPPRAGDQPSPMQISRPSSGAKVTATEYYADTVLSAPRNKETRRQLNGLKNDERLIQLCNIEAMEQLKRWKLGFTPDDVVAYATADPALKAASIEAPGAAVHASGKWYRLSFSCAATADLQHVASFAFTLGRPIPQQEWEQNSLPELVDGDPTD